MLLKHVGCGVERHQPLQEMNIDRYKMQNTVLGRDAVCQTIPRPGIRVIRVVPLNGEGLSKFSPSRNQVVKVVRAWPEVFLL